MTAKLPSKLDQFDSYIPSQPWVNPWQTNGSFESDLKLLSMLLGIAKGSSQQSGIFAAAVDVWAAEELRRAGFPVDDVWPRRTKPRVVSRDLREFIDKGLSADLKGQVVERLESGAGKSATPMEARVMGRAYRKQCDVLIASWASGIEVMISTKTMLSSYGKNLRNRFEEGYGDAKNLRGRHPLASLGFLFVVGSDIPDSSLLFAEDMLRKLTLESDVYDCACLLLIDDPAEKRLTAEEGGSAEEEAGVSAEGDLFHESDSERVPVGEPEEQRMGNRSIGLQIKRVADDLSPNVFFERLIAAALLRMPVDVYEDVRKNRANAMNGKPV